MGSVIYRLNILVLLYIYIIVLSRKMLRQDIVHVQRASLCLFLLSSWPSLAAPQRSHPDGATASRSVSVLDLPANREPCSRSQSRVARDIVRERILAVADISGGVMDPKCPFNPKLDMYLHQEEQGKQVNYRSQWLCTYSKKLFRDERYVDFHMHKYWGSKLAGGNAAVCLADWCDVLRCDGIASRGDPHRNHEHRCRAIVHACFPPVRVKSNKDVQNKLVQSLCDAPGVNGVHSASHSDSIRQHRRDASLVRSASASIGQILWYTLAVMLTVAALLFYACYGLQRWERGSSINAKRYKQW